MAYDDYDNLDWGDGLVMTADTIDLEGLDENERRQCLATFLIETRVERRNERAYRLAGGLGDLFNSTNEIHAYWDLSSADRVAMGMIEGCLDVRDLHVVRPGSC